MQHLLRKIFVATATKFVAKATHFVAVATEFVVSMKLPNLETFLLFTGNYLRVYQSIGDGSIET